MNRILLIVLLFAALIGWMLRSLRNALTRQQSGGPEKVQMVRCAHCNLYLSESEAVQAGGAYFCSEAHRVLGPSETGA